MTKATTTVENTNLTNKLPNFKQNEFGFNINFAVLDESDAVFDLTGKTIKFEVQSVSATTKKVDGTCTIDDAANGLCHYTVVDGDFDEIGLYEAELDITETGVDKRIVKLGLFAILDEI